MRAKTILLRVLVLGLLSMLPGCLLDRSGAVPGAIDAAPADASLRDGGEADAGPSTSMDASLVDAEPSMDATPDATDPDSGPACVGPPSCDGEVARRCMAGILVSEDCFEARSYCDAGACVAWACDPGSVTCSTAVEEARCDARGVGVSTQACPRGCAADVGCTLPTECTLDVFATIETSGTVELDTCGAGDDATFQPGCARVDRSGSDVIVRLDVPERADYRIDLGAGQSGVDPVVYLRTACADASSQLACDDDDGSSWSSRIDVTLDPGDYFIVADSFRDHDEGPDGRCGRMALAVSIR